MAIFWDLPRPVRDKIYRLHLASEDPITIDQHKKNANYKPIRFGKAMPALLAVSGQAENEAASIYYGENHFELSRVVEALDLGSLTHTRHLRLIRKVTCTWTGHVAYEGFLAVARMKGLQELYLRVDEEAMVRQTKYLRNRARPEIQWDRKEPTPQEQMSIVKYPGYSGLLSLSGVPHVEFIKKLSSKKDSNGKQELIGGPIPGGFLETHVLPKLQGRIRSSARIGLDDDTFPFLSLPPEVRNRIYDLLLCVPGALHPSTDKPSSAPRNAGNRKVTVPTPESTLSLLAVNKQINDEALGIFYHRNSFEFYYPTQLHAFMLSLGPERLSNLRDITLYYYNIKNGGINLAELTFPMLKQLTGLRRLHIILRNEIANQIRLSRWWLQSGWHVGAANPAFLPGIKILFALRGIEDIKLRDLKVEMEFEELKKDKEYPKFAEKSRKACVVKLTNILEHFNKALTDAQDGNVNQKLLDDREWHLKESFPIVGDAVEDREAHEV